MIKSFNFYNLHLKLTISHISHMKNIFFGTRIDSPRELQIEEVVQVHFGLAG